MKSLIGLLCVGLALGLISCGPVYDNPKEVPGVTSVVKSTIDNISYYQKRRYVLRAIDGERINYLTGGWDVDDKKIVVQPGPATLTLGGAFEFGLYKPSGYVEPTDVKVNFKSGREYRVQGYLNPSEELRMKLWIQDANTGEKISETLSLPCIFYTPSRPVPIILPVG